MESLKRPKRLMGPAGVSKLEGVRKYRPDSTHQDCPKVRRGAEKRKRSYYSKQTIRADGDSVLKKCSVERHRRPELGVYGTGPDRIVNMWNRVQDEMTTEAEDKGDGGMRRHEAREGCSNNSVGGQNHRGDPSWLSPSRLTMLNQWSSEFLDILSRNGSRSDLPLDGNWSAPSEFKEA